MKTGLAAVLAAGAMLAGCVGGDSPQPAPTPSPTPSPAPTPTPSPTPTASTYVRFADLAADTVLATGCRGFETLADGSIQRYDSLVFGDGPELAFRAADSSFTVSGMQFRYTFAAFSIKDGAKVYRLAVRGEKDPVELIFYPTEAEYSRIFTIEQGDRLSLRCVTGIETRADDLPGVQSAYLSLATGGTVHLDPTDFDTSGTSAAATFEPATGTIAWSAVLRGHDLAATPGDEQVFSLLPIGGQDPAPLAGARFVGRIEVPGGAGVSGTFGGALFGPQAAETAFLVAFDGTLSDQRVFSGDLWLSGARLR